MTITSLKEKTSQSIATFNNKNTTGIVFIDPKVDDYEMLMAGVMPGLEIFILDKNSNGIRQITEALKGHCGLSSLHIIAHGEAGSLWLGNELVNHITLDQQRNDLQFWATAFAPDADIIIYGCNVAAGEKGQHFVQILSQFTGADVAASNNLMGSAALGGNWELELQIGDVAAPLAFGMEVMEAYAAVLAYRYIVGTDGNDYLVGDTGDTLVGGAGNDTLVGHNLNGTARIYGGAGDDTYIVDSTTSILFYPLFDESGLDTVISSASSYSLGQGLDNLILTESAISGLGNGLNNVMTGNNLDNTLWGFEGNDTLSGGDGNDVLYAGGSDTGRQIIQYTPSDGDNYLDGANGNDSLYGGWGKDTLLGGAGNDYLSGYMGNDSLEGGAGNDYLRGGFDYNTGDDNDYLDGGDGNDTLIGDYGNDTLYGGYGSDTLSGGDGDDYLDGGGASFYDTSNDSLSGGNGNDTLLGGLGVDILNGDDGNDDLNGYDGNDLLNGGSGDDTLNGGAGNDLLNGGSGDDIYYVDSAGDLVTENLNEGTDTVYASLTYILGANVENLTLVGSGNGRLFDVSGNGNTLNNLIIGSNSANILNGLEGNDTLYGGGGNDLMHGGYGNDILYGEDGNDRLIGGGDEQNDQLFGGAGNDSLRGELMWGGTGNDSYDVYNASDIVTEYLNEGTDTVNSSISYTLGDNVENLNLVWDALNGIGNSLNNVITGNSQANTLNGAGGNDTLIGGAGDDTYYVDSTGDVVTENLNQGTDTVFSSIVNYTLGANLENLTLLGGAPVGYGNELNNIITGNDARNYLDGGAGNDTINGAGGNDRLFGQAGNDTLLGGEGNDYLVGFQDNDFLSGGNGNDTLEGYGGSVNEVDTLFAGAGADIFSLAFDYTSMFFYRGNGNSYAVITDFSRSEGDKMDIILDSSTNFSNYTFAQNGSDTQISYQNDLIAVVQNTVASSFIQSDFI